MAKRSRAKKKAKPGRKSVRVKIRGNPLPLIDRMLGRGGSRSHSQPVRRGGP